MTDGTTGDVTPAEPAYRIDDTAVDAATFYATACDPRGSVVVEACAGAGKTWMLVSRIVRALLDGVEPTQILAITFTRKAAGEMRDRLDEWLQDWADPSRDTDVLVEALHQRGMGSAAAAAAAPDLRNLQRRLLSAGRGVEIRTFHGWFAQLLSFAPLEVCERYGLPPTLQFIEDPAPLRAALMRRFHQRVVADAAARADYRVLVQRHRRSTVTTWLDAVWTRSAELLAADAAGELEDSVPPASVCYPEAAGVDDPAELLLLAPTGPRLAALSRAFRAKGGKTCLTAADALDAALAETDASAALDAAYAALHTKEGPRKHLAGIEGFEQACERLARLRDAVIQQRGHEDHRRMVRLARLLLDAYAEVKRSRGLVDMNDLERCAAALLADTELSGWLQERMDVRWRQVLIDEFQDTSPLQWHALSAWLEGYAGAGGGASGQKPPAVFIVGDPKQSIYRFRRAEPRVFAAARRFVVQGLHGRVLACDHTRRNASAVIDAVNGVFEEIRRAEPWGEFRTHTTASTQTGAVLRLPDVLRPPSSGGAGAGAAALTWRPSLLSPRREPEEQLRRQELRGVARAVAERLAEPGVRPGDVMVLSRRGVVLQELAEELARLGVPHVRPDALALAESPEALDIVALLDVLASPSQDLALARALKSPIFGASDDDLLWLARQAGGARWWGAMLAASAPPGAALARAQRLLQRWSEQPAPTTPHELLQRIVGEGDLRERYAAVVPPARLHAAMQAIDALLGAAIDQGGGQRGGRYATLYGFVRALRSGTLRAETAPPTEAVQLLTIHGAKGLEARIVCVVDMDPARRQPDSAMLLVDWPAESRHPVLAAFVRTGARLPPSLRSAWAAEEAANAREELNALYVAMTRAREQLVVSRTEAASRPAQAPPSWWLRVAPKALDWTPGDAAPRHGGPSVGDEVELPRRPRRVGAARGVAAAPRARTSAAGVEVTDTQAADDPAAAALGRAIHRALEWAGHRAVLDDPAAWPVLADAASRSFGVPERALPRVREAVGAILSAPSCRRYFDPAQLEWAADEVPLAWQGESLRADRIVRLRDGGAWWVLDHKLHPRPLEVPAYREQLARYVDAVRALVGDQDVHGAFVSADGVLHPT